MKSLKAIYEQYAETPERPNGTDKGTNHTYIDVYEKLLAPYRDTTRAIIEIGVKHGGSLRMWREYFPNATIYGVDINLMEGVQVDGVHLIQLNSTRPYAVNRVFADDMFDVVIDDGSHELGDQLVTTCAFWPKLGPGGIHIVEDLLFPAGQECPGTFKMFQCFDAEMTRHDMRWSGDSPHNDNAMVVLKKPGVISKAVVVPVGLQTPNTVGPEVLDEPCTVVYVTSSHCGTCLKAVPWLEQMAIAAKGNVNFVKVVVNRDASPERYYRGFKKITGWPFTIVYKAGKRVDFFYGIKSEEDYRNRVGKQIAEFLPDKGGKV